MPLGRDGRVRDASLHCWIRFMKNAFAKLNEKYRSFEPCIVVVDLPDTAMQESREQMQRGLSGEVITKRKIIVACELWLKVPEIQIQVSSPVV
jgi:hypothetical protein